MVGVNGLEKEAPKKSAEKILAEKLNEIGNGTYRDLTKATFQKFADDWIKNVEKTVKPSTMVSYRSIIKGQFIPAFGFINMVDISNGVTLIGKRDKSI